MSGKIWKRALSKFLVMIAAAICGAGLFSGLSFAQQTADTSGDFILTHETDILSLIMDAAQEEMQDYYSKIFVSICEPYLCVYEQDDASAEVIAYLYPGASGEVIESTDEWTQISSGTVTGYIYSSDAVFGKEAVALMHELGTKVVSVEAQSVNIRSEASTYAEVISYAMRDETYLVVPEGSFYDEEAGTVLTEEENLSPEYEEFETPLVNETQEMWYRIYLGDSSYGYIFADYVQFENVMKEAVPVTGEEDSAVDEAAEEEMAETDSGDAQEEEIAAVETVEETTSSEGSETSGRTSVSSSSASSVSSSSSDASSTSSSSSGVSSSSSSSSSVPSETIEDTSSDTADADDEEDDETVDDAYLLACLVYCEAGNQSYECQLAVANVVLNRVKSSKYPNTISGVIYQSGQFGPVSNGSLSRALTNGPSASCVQAANAALAGTNNIGDMLYFNNTVPSSASSSVTIGSISFYVY